mgnify:CR=1 FL=1
MTNSLVGGLALVTYEGEELYAYVAKSELASLPTIRTDCVGRQLREFLDNILGGDRHFYVLSWRE